MYKILFTDKAKKDLKKFNPAIRERIISKLKEYSLDPFSYARKLRDSSIGQYRFRISDYRVAFDVHGYEIVILRI
jgi:mRNA interferase RelE/StbE